MTLVKLDTLADFVSTTAFRQLTLDRTSKIKRLIEDDYFVISDEERIASRKRKQSFGHGTPTKLALRLHNTLLEDNLLTGTKLTTEDVYTQQILLMEKLSRVDYIETLKLRYSNGKKRKMVLMQGYIRMFDPAIRDYRESDISNTTFYSHEVSEIPGESVSMLFVTYLMEAFLSRYKIANNIGFGMGDVYLKEHQIKDLLANALEDGKEIGIRENHFYIKDVETGKNETWHCKGKLH